MSLRRRGDGAPPPLDDARRGDLADERIPLGAKNEPKQITFSAGVAAADESNDYDVADIVNRADQALYRAKRAGRNRVEME